MLVMQIVQIQSFVFRHSYLSAIGWPAQKRNSERPERCWATRTTGVPDISFAVKKTSSIVQEIYASGGGLLAASAHKRASLV